MFDPPLLEYPAIAELATYRQWLCWRLVKRVGKDGKEKDTKEPTSPHIGVYDFATVTKPDTWGTFSEACTAVIKKPSFSGVGFVLTKSDPFIFVDIDDCLDEKGEIKKWAKAILELCPSFTEISPSGSGLHIFGRGQLPDTARAPTGVQSGKTFHWGGWYDHSRYFTVTGKQWPGSPDTLQDISQGLAILAERYKKYPDPEKPTEPAKAGATAPGALGSVIAAIEPVVNGNGEWPKARLDILMINTPAVRETWERSKQVEGWSASEWDLSLASYLMNASFHDAEIVATLIQFRSKHGEDLKLRPDYYARTLLKAHSNRAEAAAYSQLTVGFGDISDPDEKRTAILDAINTALFAHRNGAKIAGIVKYTSDPPKYKLVSTKGAITGDIGLIASQTKFRESVMSCAGIVIPKFTDSKWMPITQNLLDACTEESIGDEATDAGFARTLIRAYLKQRRAVADEASMADALSEGNPFRKDGLTYIVGSDLQIFCRLQHGGGSPSGKELGVKLRAKGLECESEVVVYVNREGKRTSRSCWKVPAAVLGEEADASA